MSLQPCLRLAQHGCKVRAAVGRAICWALADCLQRNGLTMYSQPGRLSRLACLRLAAARLAGVRGAGVPGCRRRLATPARSMMASLVAHDFVRLGSGRGVA
jgi:hypothetical protein